MSRRGWFFFSRRPRPTIEPPPPRRPLRTDAVRPPGGPGAKRRDPPPPDPEDARRDRLRRRAIGLALGSLFAIGCLAALFGERGWLDLKRAEHERRALQEEVLREREHVAALAREVQRLREDPEALERIAREQLGMARPGEIVFLLPKEGWGSGAAGDEVPDPEGQAEGRAPTR